MSASGGVAGLINTASNVSRLMGGAKGGNKGGNNSGGAIKGESAGK